MPAFPTNDFALYDPTDPTKVIKFAASTISTGNVRTATMPDSDTTIGGGGGGAHEILSATHTDSLTDTVVAGDLIIGNATPKWARLPKSTDGKVLTLTAGLPAWETASVPALTYSPGSFTVATETAKIMSRHLKLTTTERATLAGTATLRIT